ncbi:MAG: S4 domain-containing protein, partial [Candidatus Izemoplasmatales bacterium]
MDDIFFEYLVKDTDTLDRIDRFLTERIESLSRSTIKKLIDEGQVTINQEPVKASYKVKIDDLIEINEVDLSETTVVPVKMNLDIVYEDDDVLVINKPSGMV